jgi:hypothetical protein
MKFRNDLNMESLLTVKEAAALTNLSVPTFYTPQRKRDFGHIPGSQETWLIPVYLLVKHGLLTEDFEPTRSKKNFGLVASEEALAQLQSENQDLRAMVAELTNKVSVLEVMVSEKQQQLEMVNNIIFQMGKTPPQSGERE